MGEKIGPYVGEELSSLKDPSQGWEVSILFQFQMSIVRAESRVLFGETSGLKCVSQVFNKNIPQGLGCEY